MKVVLITDEGNALGSHAIRELNGALLHFGATAQSALGRNSPNLRYGEWRKRTRLFSGLWRL
jgi:hypothetical protein